MDYRIEFYNRRYNIPTIVSEEKVSPALFRRLKKDHLFVTISIYNPQKALLLLRNLDKDIGWEFPGGYVEDSEHIEDAVNRIVSRETSMDIDELCPIAIMQNRFSADGYKFIQHIGVAFAARSRKKVVNSHTELQYVFLREIPEKVAYQNRDIFIFAMKYLENKKTIPPVQEIDSIRTKILYYFLNKYIVRCIGRLASDRIRDKIFSLVINKPESLLDASCGDSKLIYEMKDRFSLQECVANDISWRTISFIRKNTDGVFFTNHDVISLPFSSKFDLVIFKNTLHHLRRSQQKQALLGLIKLSDNLIIVDIEHPRKTNLTARLWNLYYTAFLGDQGENFLTFTEFEDLVQTCAKDNGKRAHTDKIRTIKGFYMFALIY